MHTVDANADPLSYKEGIHQDSSQFWHPGGAINISLLYK